MSVEVAKLHGWALAEESNLHVAKLHGWSVVEESNLHVGKIHGWVLVDLVVLPTKGSNRSRLNRLGNLHSFPGN